MLPQARLRALIQLNPKVRPDDAGMPRQAGRRPARMATG